MGGDLLNSGSETENVERSYSKLSLNSSNNIFGKKYCGDSLGSFNGIIAYYNSGGINSCDGSRHYSKDNYSYGLKWQCVEYVRRYYKDYFSHEMNRYGNASDYFRSNIPSGSINPERNLLQYHNGDKKPKKHDLIVFQEMAGGLGHVSIVTNVTDTTVLTIAQNVGMDCTDVLPLNENKIGGGCAGFLRIDTI